VTDIENEPKPTATLFTETLWKLWSRSHSLSKICETWQIVPFWLEPPFHEDRGATSKEFDVDVERRLLFDGT